MSRQSGALLVTFQWEFAFAKCAHIRTPSGLDCTINGKKVDWMLPSFAVTK